MFAWLQWLARTSLRENEAVMNNRGVDTRGIQHAKGKTFHWTGEYGENVNEAKTLNTELNVFEKFEPRIPAEYNDTDFLFLANIDPVLQIAGARRHAEREAGGRRHHELLDQRPPPEPWGRC